MKLEICVPNWRGVAERWKHQYFIDRGDKWYSDDRLATYEAIVAAGTDVKKIAGVIGNKTWTHRRCAECDEYCDRLLIIGDQTYNDNPPAVCVDCLRTGYFAMTGQEL
jgi:hypothetical protein